MSRNKQATPNKDDRLAFGRIIAAYANILRHDISTDAVEIWWRKLSRFDLLAIAKAFSQHTDQSKFFPTPSEILALLEPHRERSPLMAWAEVEQAMANQGPYATVLFADPVTNAVIRDMGWPWLCQQNLDAPWTQKEFERRYGEYQKHGVSHSEPLTGLVEQENRLNGFHDHIPEPVVIGEGKVSLPEPDRTSEVLSKLRALVEEGQSTKTAAP